MHRMTEFRKLHEQICPKLSPRLPAKFPFAQSAAPRIFQSAEVPEERRLGLEGYLRQAVEAARGALPEELVRFLALPDSFLASSRKSAAPPAAPPAAAAPKITASSEGKGVATAEWEFPAANFFWAREIGQGAFGTVFEVRMGGMTMAAKKILCTVPSEREAIVSMCRREFRALHRVQHPNIVQLMGVIVDDPKSVSLLMELAPHGRHAHVE